MLTATGWKSYPARGGEGMETVTEQSRWDCGKCGGPLVEAPVEIRYLGNTFTLPMLTCPVCSAAMVSEEMAVGKMHEAEKILEDK